ncbi:27306_t:CDS:2, partial [Gigaspora margarita]
LENAWAVHFENRKMIRLMKGYFDAKTLTERSRYKLIAKNILKWAIENTLTTKHNHNTKGKEIVTGSNAIKIINKRSFSSSGDNRDINSQKVISEETRYESLKEQDREAPRVRFKAIKMSKENPYMNNSSASNMFKEKAHKLDINEIKNLLLNITSRLNSIERS